MAALTGQTDAVRMLWDRQSVWSQAANGLKTRVARARLATLGLTVAGAVFGTAAAQLGGHVAGRVCAGIAAAALALVALTTRGMSRTAIQQWTRVRSVSEAIKGDVYTYLSGVTPYRDEDRTDVLLRRFAALMDVADDLVGHTAAVSPRVRPVPDIVDVASYASVRVRSQIDDYYRPNAREMVRRARRLTRVQVGLAALSAVLAAIAGVFPAIGLTAWIAVLTTVSAAVTAHLGASRYEYQQIEFTRTADELERLLARQSATRTEPTIADQFVAACERIISIQNEAWMVSVDSSADAHHPDQAT